MDHYNIIQEYTEIRLQSMMPELMRSVFSIIGIFPFNDTLFTDHDFTPAKSFSNSMHVPQSFPAEVPTSSPAASDASDMELSSNESDSGEDVAEDTPAAQTHFSWETNSDDFDDEHPSYLTASTSAAMPTEALAPSRLIVPAAVPITGTITSPSPLVHATRTTLASCPLLITSLTPPVPTPPTSVSHYVGTSNDAGPYATRTSSYFTRSQVSQIISLSLNSSPALSVSLALDPIESPQPQSIQELLGENRRLWLTVELMKREAEKEKANNAAINAHCTIMM